MTNPILEKTQPKTESWEDGLYELSGGADDYGHCMVDVEKVISLIKGLLSQSKSQQMEEIIEEVKGMKKQYHSVGGGEIGGYVDVPDDAYNRSVQKHNEIIDEVLSKLTSPKDENSGLEEK